MMTKEPLSPQEKKILSLKNDRRNTYGENAKSSRKNIPLSKAISHRKVRRTAKQLTGILEQIGEAAAEVVQSTVTTAKTQKGPWRKTPDKSLGIVLERKSRRRNATTP